LVSVNKIEQIIDVVQWQLTDQKVHW